MNEEIKNTTPEVTDDGTETTEDTVQTTEAEVKEEKAEKEEKLDRKEKKLLKKLEGELADLMTKNAQLEGELAQEQDRALRVMAEYDNFRRRSRAERESVYADAYADAILEILPIIDNLERAEAYNSSDDVNTGVAMILNGAREALKKMGVEEIEALGCEFDPNVHNAVMHTEDESLGENVISAVLQKGYKRGDKIIRYAMVQVAKTYRRK